VLSDGDVTLNIRPRVPGHRVGLDHFGIEVDDIDATFDRLRIDYPAIGWIEQPRDGADGDYFTHDPAGSIFSPSNSVGERSATSYQARPLAAW